MQNVYLKDDEDYPELLRQAGKDAPKQIYCKCGDSKTHPSPPLSGREQEEGARGIFSSPDKGRLGGVSSIFNNCLSVIGSRRLTSYGKQVLEQLVSQIASPRPAGQAGITIVSGFMYGGDAIAHRSALQVGGRTIAVMPCGIDRIHPQDQEELYHDILENKGLVISEYEGDMQPTLWTYPRRNRIVAGLSQALLIVEAGEKSGCLITANYAKKFKRKIFVVPGPITSSVSKGSNMLIKQGAEMVTEAGDVLGWFRDKTHPDPPLSGREREKGEINSSPGREREKGEINSSPGRELEKKEINSSPDKGRLGGVSSFETQVLEMLAREPMGVDELSRQLEMSSSDLGVKLSMMQIKGLIETRGSKYINK